MPAFSTSFQIMAARRVLEQKEFSLGGLLGGARLQQRAVNLHLDVARQQAVEQLRRRLLVEVVYFGLARLGHAGRDPALCAVG